MVVNGATDGRVFLTYLRAVLADLNLIKMAWSKLKGFLRRVAAPSTEALDPAIGQGPKIIGASDARSFFQHCDYTAYSIAWCSRREQSP